MLTREKNREQVIKELSKGFIATEKEQSANRYLKATGTLLSAGSFSNYAKCNRSVNGFTENRIYRCGPLIGDSVETSDDFGCTVLLRLSDVDFEFTLNKLND